MPLDWTAEHADLIHARWPLSGERALEVQVESLWEDSWDWHVWDSAGALQPRYGLAGTLEGARAKAEAALDGMLWELKLIRMIPRLPATTSTMGQEAAV